MGSIDPDRKEQLEAVKHWYNDDRKSLDKTLRQPQEQVREEPDFSCEV